MRKHNKFVVSSNNGVTTLANGLVEMRTASIWIFINLCLVLVNFEDNLRAENLQQAWASALSPDPGLEASRWNSSAAQSGLASARSERLPSISGRSSYSVFDNPLSYQVNVPPIPPVLPNGASGSVDINIRGEYRAGRSVWPTLAVRTCWNNYPRSHSAVAGVPVVQALFASRRQAVEVEADHFRTC